MSAPTAKQAAKKQNKKIIKAAKKASKDAAVTTSQINNAQKELVKAVEKSFKSVADAVNVQKKATDKLTARITGATGSISKKTQHLVRKETLPLHLPMYQIQLVLVWLVVQALLLQALCRI